MAGVSIREAEGNIAKLQTALDDAQRVLKAAEQAQAGAQRAHNWAERHAALLRATTVLAIAALVVGAVLAMRRRHSSAPNHPGSADANRDADS